MKKSLVIFFVLICAALSVLSVSAAYYDQNGNARWCNRDSYGCWVTGENGEHEYIMFWSEAARDYIMGKGSNAPIVERFSAGVLPLKGSAALSEAAASGGNESGNSGGNEGSNTGGNESGGEGSGGDTSGGDTSGGGSSGGEGNGSSGGESGGESAGGEGTGAGEESGGSTCGGSGADDSSGGC